MQSGPTWQSQIVYLGVTQGCLQQHRNSKLYMAFDLTTSAHALIKAQAEKTIRPNIHEYV